VLLISGGGQRGVFAARLLNRGAAMHHAAPHQTVRDRDSQRRQNRPPIGHHEPDDEQADDQGSRVPILVFRLGTNWARGPVRFSKNCL
jgi:hypothetical protein